jgi:hypothetical protein
MKLPQWPLQVAIYDRLSTDLDVPVYDEVPTKAKPPYVVIGEDTGVGYGHKMANGQEVTITLHVWSETPGMSEVKDLMSQVVDSITDYRLSLGDGWSTTMPALDMADTMRDPGGYRHGVLRFRCKILEV